MTLSQKERLLRSTILSCFAAGAVFAAPAFAQDEDVETTSQAEEPADNVERVQVTGSRILRPEVDTVFPTISTDAQLFEDAAFTNIGDALNEIPGFGGGIDPLGDQGANIGVNFVDFLELGTQRTLTLVNGRRFVSQNSAGTGQQVDFNVIPLALVDRIDVIGVGGAPIYGSDAIAGTINVILKDDFEGFEFTTQLGRTEKGDAEDIQFQIVAGANTADGRGNVTFSAEYFNSEGLRQLDRPDIYVGEPFYSQVGSESTFGEGGTPIDLNGDGDTTDGVNQLFFGGNNVQLFTNGGVVAPTNSFIPSLGAGDLADGNFYGFDPNGNLVTLEPGVTAPGSSVFFAEGGFPNDFFAEVDQIRSPVERVVFGSTFRYDITSNIRATADVQIANTEGIELVDQGGFQTFAFDGFSDGLRIPLTNPFLNDQALGILADNGFDTSADSTDVFFLQRFNNDIIDSSNGSESTTWRIAGGLEGDFSFANREFNWNVSGNAGQFTNETFGTLINDRRFLLAVDAVALTQADVDALVAAGAPLTGDGSVTPAFGGVGDVVCRTRLEYTLADLTGDSATITSILESQGLAGSGIQDDAPVDITQCEPLNLFGEGAPSEEALAYVVQRETQNNDINQSVWTANFGGELFDLPGGTVAFNVGYETRRESARFRPGAGLETGLGRSAEVPPTGGSYITNEYYGEVLVPLVSPDMEFPFLHTAEFEGAYRYIDNSIAGTGEAWTLGGRISPIEGLQFRGNQTRSLRAPSLDELFQPVVTSFQFSADPCDQRFIDDGANRRANCAAEGVVLDSDRDGVEDFISNVANATASGTTGGNPNLQNETSDAYTIGVYWEPAEISRLSFLEGFSAQADYIYLEIEDLITAFDLETIMETCYDSDPAAFPNSFCSLFQRDEFGQVVDFQSGQTNADSLEAEFLQWFFQYDFDVADVPYIGNRLGGDPGAFNLDLRLFQVLNRDQVVAGVNRPGGQDGLGGFADPRLTGTFDVTYNKGPLRVFYRLAFQDSARASADETAVFFDENGDVVTDTNAYFVSDLTAAYDVSSFISGYDNPIIAQVGVLNLFDQNVDDDPVQRALGDFTIDDQLGRRFTFRLRTVF